MKSPIIFTFILISLFSFSGVPKAEAAAPNAPAITPNALNGLTYVSYPFNFQATDPDGNQIRYVIDWNNDGVDDETVPSSFVNSGTTVTASNPSTLWTVAGSYRFRVRTIDSTGQSSANSTGFVTVVNAPTVDLKVDYLDGPVTFGGAPYSYTLSWTNTNSTSCTASGSWSGSKNLNSSQAFNAMPEGNYTYTLTCSNAAGTASDTVNMGVANPIFAPDPVITTPAACDSGAINLTWTAVSNATSYEVSADNFARTFIVGNVTSFSDTGLNPGSTHNYYVRGLNQTSGPNNYNDIYYSHLAQGTAAPACVQQPSVTLTPESLIIKKGTPTNLTWSTSGSINGCQAFGDWSGMKAVGGGTESTGNLNTLRTYQYSIVCYVSNSTSTVTAQGSVLVIDGDVNAVSPKDYGATTTVTWTTQNTAGLVCEVTDGTDSWSPATSGTQASHVLSGPGQYVLACGPDLTHLVLLDAAQVLVNSTPILTVSPRVVRPGDDATLYWTVYENGCTLRGGGTQQAIAGTGSASFQVTAKTTYTASCPSTGSAAVTVEITPTGFES
jgi:hypothetical protein